MESLWPELFPRIRTGEGSFPNRVVLTARARQHCMSPIQATNALEIPLSKAQVMSLCVTTEEK